MKKTRKRKKRKRISLKGKFPKIKIVKTTKGERRYMTNPVAEDQFRVKFP